MNDVCQSCRRAPVSAIEMREEFHEPLALCADCLARLDSHSLRPLEWYNLGAIHGHQSEALGEDYYDEATGRALAPAEPVVDADRFPCPALSDVADCPDELLTYILMRSRVERDAVMARQSTEPKLVAAMRRPIIPWRWNGG